MYKYLALFLGTTIFAHSQTLQREVISSQGGYYFDNNIDLSWCLGEVVTDTYTGNQSFFLTQGFEQPIFKTTSDTLLVTEPLEYPNPTDGPINFLFPNSDTYTIKCYDIIGQIIFEETFTSNYLKINVSYLSNAYYVFLIVNEKGDFIHRVKILKIN
jgi:hypothetical protein